MVEITFFRDRNRQLTGFDCAGHAEYRDGNDVVCAAVSALAITCVNSVEELTGARFSLESCRADGVLSFRLLDVCAADAQLLLRSMALGLGEIENNYENHVDILYVSDEEVTT